MKQVFEQNLAFYNLKNYLECISGLRVSSKEAIRHLGKLVWLSKNMSLLGYVFVLLNFFFLERLKKNDVQRMFQNKPMQKKNGGSVSLCF